MESLKIDVRGLSQAQKNNAAEKLRGLGYVGVPYPSNFFFYCIYASGVPSKHGYSLAFGNNMKTFSNNNGREITINELNNMIDS